MIPVYHLGQLPPWAVRIPHPVVASVRCRERSETRGRLSPRWRTDRHSTTWLSNLRGCPAVARLAGLQAGPEPRTRASRGDILVAVPNEALVAAVKNIVVLSKSGKEDEAYTAYASLYASPPFASYSPADQRQALKLMILAKGIPTFPSASIVEAHRAAIGPLQALVHAQGEPADYQMLGICFTRTGDEAQARASFQAGLDIERARDPQSPLCGSLMKYVASV
jgi:hypothetical protein